MFWHLVVNPARALPFEAAGGPAVPRSLAHLLKHGAHIAGEEQSVDIEHVAQYPTSS